jgi:hypothetical protein
VNVGLFEDFASYRFPGAALEKHVVGNNDRGAAVLLQDGEDVLEKVELFVAGARPDCPRGSACNKKGGANLQSRGGGKSSRLTTSDCLSSSPVSLTMVTPLSLPIKAERKGLGGP